MVLPTTKKPRGSWIQEHGYSLVVQKDRDILRYQLCKSCYNSSVPLLRTSYLIKLERNTTKVIDYLEKSHSFDHKGKTQPTKKHKYNNLHASQTQQQRDYDSIFNTTKWKDIYMHQTIYSGVSLYKAVSTYYNELLVFQNMCVKDVLPTSHSTIVLQILQAYKEAIPKVSQVLAKATSKLTLSFNRQTTNNKVLDLLGIVIYYLNENHEHRIVVLSS